MVANANIVVGPFVTPKGGFVYTTDDGLKMGLPHMFTKSRIADLGNTSKVSGAHQNVFSNSARITCSGQSLTNTEGKLSLGAGDNGLRLAFLSALDAMMKCHELDKKPDTLVFEVEDELTAAKICGLLHAFPINFSGFGTRIKDENARLVFDGAQIRYNDESIPILKNAQTPAAFRGLNEFQKNTKLHEYLKTTTKIANSVPGRNKVFNHRGKLMLNQLKPFKVEKDKVVDIPSHFLLNCPLIPCIYKGTKFHINNSTIDDPRLLLLQHVVYRCTEPVDDFVLVRPFPQQVEIQKLRNAILTKADLLFL